METTLNLFCFNVASIFLNRVPRFSWLLIIQWTPAHMRAVWSLSFSLFALGSLLHYCCLVDGMLFLSVELKLPLSSTPIKETQESLLVKERCIHVLLSQRWAYHSIFGFAHILEIYQSLQFWCDSKLAGISWTW